MAKKETTPLAVRVAEQKKINKARAQAIKDGKFTKINEQQIKAEQNGESETEED